jgi:hypothetical protein
MISQHCFQNLKISQIVPQRSFELAERAERLLALSGVPMDESERTQTLAEISWHLAKETPSHHEIQWMGGSYGNVQEAGLCLSYGKQTGLNLVALHTGLHGTEPHLPPLFGEAMGLCDSARAEENFATVLAEMGWDLAPRATEYEVCEAMALEGLRLEKDAQTGELFSVRGTMLVLFGMSAERLVCLTLVDLEQLLKNRIDHYEIPMAADMDEANTVILESFLGSALLAPLPTLQKELNRLQQEPWQVACQQFGLVREENRILPTGRRFSWRTSSEPEMAMDGGLDAEEYFQDER